MGLYTPPIIDLDTVEDEEGLVKTLREILVQHDSFLLEHYANFGAMNNAMSKVYNEEMVYTEGFDRRFDGVVDMGAYRMKQRVVSWGEQGKEGDMDESRESEFVKNKLVKVAEYFSKKCIESLGLGQGGFISEGSYILRRYDSNFGDTMLDMQFDYAEKEWVDYQALGLVCVVPDAKCVKVHRNGMWHEIDVEECLLVHTGEALELLSNGMYTTSGIRLSMNSLVLSWQPGFEYTLPNGETMFNFFLKQQMEEFPGAAEAFYPRELRVLNLGKNVQFIKSLFDSLDSMITLFKMNHPGTDFVDVESLVPSVSRMLKKKVSSSDFQRLLYIWPDAYNIEINSVSGISLKLPDQLSITKSRLLQFSELLEQWHKRVLLQDDIPETIPLFKIGKRKASNSTLPPMLSSKLANKRAIAPLKGTSKSLKCNSVDGNDSNVSLLNRIRDKERRAAALLSQRLLHQEQFLNVKMKQVFQICMTLESETPYTEVYLLGLIVDSLTDTNNPIGQDETVRVLKKLGETLGADKFQIIEVEGNMRVYKWKPLNQSML